MKTKYLLLLILINFSFLLNCFAKGEIIYLSTDRDFYIAGENMWLSLFSFTKDNESSLMLNNHNKIAYIEISNSSGTVITEKILITDSRGSGIINLPPNLPSGFYNIYAYTNNETNLNETPLFKKRFAIINTLISQSVQEGVIVEKEDSSSITGNNYQTIDNLNNASKNLKIAKKENKVYLENTGSENLTLSLSIYNTSQIEEDLNPSGISTYLKNTIDHKYSQFDFSEAINFEGEVIKGSVTDMDGNIVAGHQLFLSVAQDKSNIYSTITDSLGMFKIYTYPIFGERELYLETITSDTLNSFNYSILDPFRRINGDSFPTLNIKKSYEKELIKRSYEMQIYRRSMADTLLKFKSILSDPLLNYNLNKEYILDHYTRFPFIRDILIEYVKELQHRIINNKPTIRMIWQDRVGNIHVSYGNSLILLDGIPIFDHSQIINYDPLKIETLKLYPGEYHIGPSKFEGIVLFNTYKNDFADLKIKDNARLIEFKGVLNPIESSYNFSKDWVYKLSSLIFWNPIISLKGGEKIEIDLSKSNLSNRKDKITYKVEGFSKEGSSPIYLKGNL